MMDTPRASYAGFWKRFAAYILDSILIGIVSFFVVAPVLVFFGVGIGISATKGSPEDLVGVIIAALVGYLFVSLVLVVATWLYFALMESSEQQGTLGKMALGIKVTDLDGGRVTFGRATGRYFAKFISSLTFGIGYILAGFTEKKQALHDMIASCLVVNK